MAHKAYLVTPAIEERQQPNYKGGHLLPLCISTRANGSVKRDVLLGLSVRYKSWLPIGGTRTTPDTSSLHTACREFLEETRQASDAEAVDALVHRCRPLLRNTVYYPNGDSFVYTVLLSLTEVQQVIDYFHLPSNPHDKPANLELRDVRLVPWPLLSDACARGFNLGQAYDKFFTNYEILRADTAQQCTKDPDDETQRCYCVKCAKAYIDDEAIPYWNAAVDSTIFKLRTKPDTRIILGPLESQYSGLRAGLIDARTQTVHINIRNNQSPEWIVLFPWCLSVGGGLNRAAPVSSFQ